MSRALRSSGGCAPGATRRLRAGVALSTAVLAAAVLGTTSAPARAESAGRAPDQIGSWTPAFEEGGSAVPRCVHGTADQWLCKPAAANITALPDGRVLYYNGLEGSENVRNAVLFEIAPASRND